jgi:hypothetical protein
LIADEIPGLIAITELRFPAAAGGSKVDGEDLGCVPEALDTVEDPCDEGSGCPKDEVDSCNGGGDNALTSFLSRTLKVAAKV